MIRKEIIIDGKTLNIKENMRYRGAGMPEKGLNKAIEAHRITANEVSTARVIFLCAGRTKLCKVPPVFALLKLTAAGNQIVLLCGKIGISEALKPLSSVRFSFDNSHHFIRISLPVHQLLVQVHKPAALCDCRKSTLYFRTNITEH